MSTRSQRLRRVGALAVLVVSALVGPAVPASYAAPETPYRVKAHLVDEQVNLGVEVQIYGTVRPLAPGRRVRIQVRPVGGPWRTVAVSFLSPHRGTWDYPYMAPAAGTYELRAIKNRSDGHSMGVSEIVTATVVSNTLPG